MSALGEHRSDCAFMTAPFSETMQTPCDCDPDHRELPVTIPSVQVQIAARVLCPAASQGGPCSRCVDAVTAGVARGQNATLQRELELQSKLDARLRHPAEGHVLDRYGNVWALVRDGGMVTRADYAGVLSMGVAAAEAEVGPLVPLMEWRPTRWWRAVLPDGTLLMESSDEREVRGYGKRTPAAKVQRLMETSPWSRWEDA